MANKISPDYIKSKINTDKMMHSSKIIIKNVNGVYELTRSSLNYIKKEALYIKISCKISRIDKKYLK